MRRFYFHVKNGQVTKLDQEGAEFADEEEAAKEAARRGGEIARRSALTGVTPGGVILVVDEQWQPVCGVPFDVTTSVRNMAKKRAHGSGRD